jgi:signal transduction histidine kinase
MRSFRSIRNKLLMLVLVTTFCALAVASVIILIYDIRDYRDTRINDMRTQIQLLAYATVPALQFEDASVADANLALLRLRPSVQAAAIYNARGQLFASYGRADLEPQFPALPEADSIRTDDTGMAIFSRIIEDGEILGTAYIRGDYLLIERILAFMQIVAGGLLGAMLVATLICLWLQSGITNPIKSIATVARDVVTRKEFDRRAEKNSADEVGMLVDAFNEMLEEIDMRTRALEMSNLNLAAEIGKHEESRELVLQLNSELEQKVRERTRELETINQELETFCYSVSHDLRSPLRSISGFSQALIEELPGELSGDARRYFDKIIAATSRMGQLIEDLLNLSRVSRGELVRQELCFSTLAREVAHDVQGVYPHLAPELSVWDAIDAEADPKLLRIALENLLGNAWKFSGKQDNPRIEVGMLKDGTREIYFVRDNGVGFDMKYADKLFGPFQRLHAVHEFPGTGIGLATVQRIIHRHGGRIWCDSTPGVSTTFYFTLKHDQPDAAANSAGTPDGQQAAGTA